MGDGAKGTIASLDSLFSPEEVQKAALRVEDAIADRRKELDRLRGFISDNSALIHLVRKLPDELSHDIMVPFGSAAFFPGRLIHTNEFLVLLGEGYYADRTAKQTIEILQRRGKALEAQVEFLKAMMSDLEAESKFFNSTATEAAEGLVEIREEYIEDAPKDVSESGRYFSNPLDSSKEDNSGKPDEDEVHARIMAKLDELEKEEIEDGSASGSDEDAEDSFQSNVNDDKNEASKIADLSMQFSTKAGSFQCDKEQPDSMQKSPLPPERKENLHKASIPKLEDSSENSASQTSKIGSSSHRAFTGSIVEHSHGLAPVQSAKSPTPEQASGSYPSKPVSRFKMQKGIR
ncbi:RNA polymerase II subunit 5-mediating protein homolog isoform X2 [Phoenix dactylifera]|uniref:RNA polymerase II subunit 5-mediating protein homolog isoform X2 n=1 Tax=Phoenix dactylifera TaxID=42345 RepID=A0A8B7D5J9_PHODC|nr:RNA polymerase II subunit 5-mediating protein homolog isoform X2 [Phoenix dactylifera]